MAKCDFCKKDMTKAKGCLEGELKIDGEWYKRRTDSIFDGLIDSTKACHDCAAEPGHYHHRHCDAEKCPKCGGQLLSCGCKVTEVRFKETV